MAVLNFPINPGAQTPVNTYSKTSTPDNTASSNNATYIWNGVVWTGATGGSFLSLLVDAGPQTVQTSEVTTFTGKVTSALTTDLDPVNTLATKGYIKDITDTITDTYLPLSGGTMTGPIVFASNQPNASSTVKGIVTISDSINSTSSTTAGSSYAVKLAYDHATDAFDKANDVAANALLKSGGTMTGPIVFSGNQQKATTSVYGITQLNSTVTSTSTTLAGTASAVKLAYDKATSAQSKADGALLRTGGNMTGNITFGSKITLATNGTASFSGTVTSSGNFNSTSDIRVKENIKPLENSLSKVNQLRAVEYDRTDIRCHQIGVIAQEIEKVYPDFVSTDSEGMKSVSYGQMVSVLIEAVKELSQEVDKLKEVINN